VVAIISIHLLYKPHPMKNLILTCLIFNFLSTFAQESLQSTLHLQIVKMDSLLFEEGFNNCDFKVLEEILSPDLEFYHDKGGVQNKTEFITASRNNICNSPNGKITRKAVPGSIQVFAMENNGALYGALQTGTHEFFMQPPGQKVQKTGIAKFTCLWLLNDKKEWILKRVFSYDHKPAE
jgi:Domain of unknown function (DUF4440)